MFCCADKNRSLTEWVQRKMQGKLVTLSRGFAIKKRRKMGSEMGRLKESFLKVGELIAYL